MINIFKQFPNLSGKIPYTPLGSFPTPVEKIDTGGVLSGIGSLYVKRDDMSGPLYGGNKVRKLEFLLGEALAKGAESVLTFGFSGSNHALATAFYAKSAGLKCISVLMPQPISHHVRHNLLLQILSGAELHYCGNYALTLPRAIVQLLSEKSKTGKFPMIIPPGGSTPSGALGFVSAAFELKEQVESGLLPEPDYLYVTLGTAGTAAGLTLGLKMAGMKTKVISVLVVDELWMNQKNYMKSAESAQKYLRSIDPTIPAVNLKPDDFVVRTEFFGREYGLFTQEGQEAVSIMKQLSGINLDGTYTGKTFAAIVHDSRAGRLEGKNVLYWNTLSSKDFSKEESKIDYRELPKQFHKVFTEDVQELDS
jgi:D-cysteine desulfhydrase